MALLAEELLLLLLDDERGTLTASAAADAGIGGALLTELAVSGMVDVQGGGGWFSRTTVRVAGGAAPADPLLTRAAEVVAEKPRTAQSLVGRLGKDARGPLLDRLVRRGLLHRDEDRVLGIFPRTRWPAADTRHEEQVRAELARAIAQGRPDERSGALLALLSAMDAAHKVLTVPGLTAREIRARARAAAQGEWAAQAVRDAVAAAQAATIGAVTAATAATSAGAG